MSTSSLLRHLCRSARVHQHLRPNLIPSSQRSIHSTLSVQKKKGKDVTEDLFAEDVFAAEEDLFKDASAPTASSAGTSGPGGSDSEKIAKSKRLPKLSPGNRLKRLDKLLGFIEPRLGRNPAQEVPLVRKVSWLTALDLVANGEQMQRVVELFPKLKEGKGEFPEGFAEAFTRRCDELNCTDVALSTFGNFAKYNLPLTLPAARWLLYALRSQPTSQTLLATSFFEVYKLKPITRDLPSAALLAATCYDPKHRTEDTLKIANTLLPHIQKMLKTQSAKLASANNAEELRTKQWTTKALRQLNFFAKQYGGQVPLSVDLLPTRVQLQTAVKEVR